MAIFVASGANMALLVILSLVRFVLSQDSMNGLYPPPINALPSFKVQHRGRYFELLSHPVSYQYSEVFWKPQPAIPLPPDVVAEFANRSISITGFEVDVLRLNATGGLESVPAYEAYNHHYCCTLLGAQAKMVNMGPPGELGFRGFGVHEPEMMPRPRPGAFGDDSWIPTAHNFWQGNGGEYRKSFKYLPTGFGQMISSPNEWVLQPMLINTKNPDGSGNRGGPLPRNSQAPPGANYSGLLECPCTTRTTKVFSQYKTLSSGSCGNTSVTEAVECFRSINSSLGAPVSQSVIDNTAFPPGCFAVALQHGYAAYFNNNSASTIPCGMGSGLIRAVGSEQGESLLSLDLDENTGNITINMTGPAEVWFGVGFGATSMSDLPYTIVIDGNGVVQERNLADHDAGSVLPPSVEIISSSVGSSDIHNALRKDHYGWPTKESSSPSKEMCANTCSSNAWCKAWTYRSPRLVPPLHYNYLPGVCIIRGGLSNQAGTRAGFKTDTSVDGVWSAEKGALMRSVVMRRSLVGLDSRYYSFNATATGISFINAVGNSAEFAYHGSTRGGYTLMLLEVGRPLCLCRGSGDAGTINGIQFSQNCLPYPGSTVLRDHNPSCSLETYNGGTMCCSHGTFLLDADQEVPAPVDTVYMKFRFYYEDPSVYPNYENAFFVFRQTEANHGEYDVVKCPEGTPPSDCIHTVTGHLQIKDVISPCTSRSQVMCAPSNGPWPQSQYIQFLHISPHCHAPACISMEIINADTNETICKIEPIFGNSTTQIMNEAGYLYGIPPCVWGYQEEGLLPPPIVSLDTNITLIKKANATYTHYGVMGHWQMRAAWYMGPRN